MGAAERKMRVLLLCASRIPSVILCGGAQLRDLDARGLLEFRERTEKDVTADDLRWADIAVLSRLDSLLGRECAKRMRKAGKTLVYMLDDDLLHVPASCQSARHYAQKVVQRNIRNTMARCDALLSPSPEILARYARAGQQQLLVEEPALFFTPPVPKPEGVPVRIGVAATPDRQADIEGVLAGALKRVHAACGERVVFEFFGAAPSFASAIGATALPFQPDYESYLHTLHARQWDIALAPMPDTPFHRCKHYIKFVEYASAGAAGVFSAVPPYTRLAMDKGIGVWCENSEDAWYAAVMALIADQEKRESIRRAASDYAQAHCTIAAASGALFEALQALKRSDQADHTRYPLGPLKIASEALRLCVALRTHGADAPRAAWRKIRQGK